MSAPQGKSWLPQGQAMTPAEAEARARAQATADLQSIMGAVSSRMELWADLHQRGTTALSSSTTGSIELAALAREAHKRLAKGW